MSQSRTRRHLFGRTVAMGIAGLLAVFAGCSSGSSDKSSPGDGGSTDGIQRIERWLEWQFGRQLRWELGEQFEWLEQHFER